MSVVYGQTPQRCELTLANAPNLRGFYLGMKDEEIKKKLPKIVLPKADILGYSKLSLSFFPLPDRYTSYGDDENPNSIDVEKSTQYKGWQTITFEFVDNKAVSIRLVYDSTIKWKNLTEFIKQFSEPLNVPSVWLIDSDSKDKASIDCNGFRIKSQLTGQTNPTVYFVDLDASKLIRQRENDSKNKEKKNFKP